METILFNTPYLSGKEQKYVKEVFESKHYAGNGKFTKKCQALLEEITGSKVLLTTSCTAALELTSLALDIEDGDEIIVPSYTFVSTASAYERCGAKIVFAEIEPSTLMLDIRDVKKKLTERTRAVVTVHYGGLPSDLSGLIGLCKEHDIDLIEDAAQGFGTVSMGGHLGTFGRFGTISFHETKNIHCGLGGAIYINNPEEFDRIENIWERGTNRTKLFRGLVDKYTWLESGSSFYPSELQSAFLLAQLESLNSNLKIRQKLTEQYFLHLADLETEGKLTIQKGMPTDQWNHHAVVCIFPSENICEKVRVYLKNKQINAYIGYVPLHSSPKGAEMGWKKEDLPVTEEISQRILRLPLHCEMDSGDIERVCLELRSVLE